MRILDRLGLPTIRRPFRARGADEPAQAADGGGGRDRVPVHHAPAVRAAAGRGSLRHRPDVPRRCVRPFRARVPVPFWRERCDARPPQEFEEVDHIWQDVYEARYDRYAPVTLADFEVPLQRREGGEEGEIGGRRGRARQVPRRRSLGARMARPAAEPPPTRPEAAKPPPPAWWPPEFFFAGAQRLPAGATKSRPRSSTWSRRSSSAASPRSRGR